MVLHTKFESQSFVVLQFSSNFVLANPRPNNDEIIAKVKKMIPNESFIFIAEYLNLILKRKFFLTIIYNKKFSSSIFLLRICVTE